MGSSQLSQVLTVVLLLLLCVLPCLSESALPSNYEPLSITGRRMIGHYNRIPIRTGQSSSGQGGGQSGRRLMSIYRPNGDIFARPSGSGHGGGRTPAP